MTTAAAVTEFMVTESDALSSVIPATSRMGESPAHRLRRSPSARETPVRFRPAVRMNSAISAMTAERLNPLKASCGESRPLKESPRARISAARSGRSAPLISRPAISNRISVSQTAVRENTSTGSLLSKIRYNISPG